MHSRCEWLLQLTGLNLENNTIMGFATVVWQHFCRSQSHGKHVSVNMQLEHFTIER